ncbi:MAG: helix-turn-helix domain-containing protein [Acidimicrobiales bacterium]
MALTDRLTYTVEEAAAALGISRSLAYELTRTARLAHVRLGHRIVIPRSAIDALIGTAAVVPDSAADA